ncbi:MAG: hypothetical protein VKK62_00420 [Synechococcaceae cyanobacterium]|nr:hypothetical protein [Synechococcaceae cyanobacterium]
MSAPVRARRTWAALLLLLVLSATAAMAAPYRPAPPPSRPLQLDPDAMTCTPDVISGAFAQHLRPWADQPPAVLAQLRELQGGMTRATIQRCLSQGRLSPDQAAALEKELGLSSNPAAASDSAQPSVRP